MVWSSPSTTRARNSVGLTLSISILVCMRRICRGQCVKYSATEFTGVDNVFIVKTDPRNILVLDFGQMGDVVLSLPALRAIRTRFPEARVTVAVGTAAALVVQMSGLADRLLAVDRVKLRDAPKLQSLWSLIQ